MRLSVAIVALLAAEGAVAQTVPPINCAIRPSRVVEIAAPVPGVVREVYLRPGQEVHTGDLIAVFDDDLARADLAVAEGRATATAALEATEIRRDGMKIKLERLDLARLRRVISAADFEQAQLELAIAEGEVAAQKDVLRLAALDLERAKRAVEKSRVISPVDGIVGEDPIDPGEIPATKPIVTIYVVDPMRVEAYVPTAILPELIEKSSFSIVVNGKTNDPISVTLDYVSQVADLSSDTQSVFFSLNARGILPGYKCQMLP